MKNILFILAILPIIFTSCSKDNDDHYSAEIELTANNLESDGGEYKQPYATDVTYLVFNDGVLTVRTVNVYNRVRGTYRYTISNGVINLVDESDNASYSISASISKQGDEEARMQSEFFKEVPLLFPNLPDKLLFAVPNGGSRNKIEAANLKRQGATAGVSDVICLIPKKGFASLCMEFKTNIGKQSEHQKEFQEQAEMCKNKYVIVRSVKEAIEELKSYLY